MWAVHIFSRERTCGQGIYLAEKEHVGSAYIWLGTNMWAVHIFGWERTCGQGIYLAEKERVGSACHLAGNGHRDSAYIWSPLSAER